MSRLVLALVAALALAPTLAAGQSYPTKPVRMVVPFPSGGGTDSIARVVAPRLWTSWTSTGSPLEPTFH